VRLSSLTDQAIVLMQAAYARDGGSRVNATDLALVSGIPVPTAQKLVSLLTRAGLLTAARGAGGGIDLARPAAAISLADMIEAVEGPIALTACVDHDGRHECTREAACAVRPHWKPVNDAVRGALADISLVALTGQTVRAEGAVL
jgi:Rrf2 family protein